ncbi:MAG: hypothetical protein J0665_12035 [Deltaproteobacteria bacterium]|nr:hypothetical protein [Deltaproteobacteria bacterium]
MTTASLEKFTQEFNGTISSQQRIFLQEIFSAGFTCQFSTSQKKTATFWKNGIKHGFINSEIKSPKIIGYTFQAKHNPGLSFTGVSKDASPFSSSAKTKDWFEKQYSCTENTDYQFKHNPNTNLHYVYIKDLELAQKVFGISTSLCSNHIIIREETTEGFLPSWPFVKSAIDKIPHNSPTRNEILDQVEKDALAAQRVLKKNWREITNETIPRWLAAQQA